MHYIRQKNTSGTSLSLISLGLIIAVTASLSFAYAEIDTVSVNGKSFDIHYEYMGIEVLGFSTDPALPSLIISINAPSDGTLDIILERIFLDSVSNGEDAEFLILADTDEATFSDTSTPRQRILTIDVPAGTEEIGIYGSVLGGTSDTSTSDSSTDSGDVQTENTQVTSPTDTGMADTDTGMADTDTGMADTDTGMADTDTGMADTDTGMADTDTGMADTDTGMADTDTGMADTDTGMADTDTGMADTDTGMADTDTGMADTDTGMADTDTGMTDTDPLLIVCDNGVVLDGKCVNEITGEPITQLNIDPEPSSDASVTSLVYGSVAAFIVAGAIGGILALIYKARTRSKKQS